MKFVGILGIVGSLYGIIWGGNIALVFMIISTLSASFLFLKSPKIPIALIWGASFLLIWISAGMWTDFTIPESMHKYKLIIASFFYIIVPPFIMKSKEDIEKLIKVFMWFGITITLISIPELFSGENDRLSLYGANPIALGRIYAITLLCILYMARKKKIILFLCFPFMIILILYTGSKSPLIGLFAGIVFFYRLRLKTIIAVGTAIIMSLFIGKLTLPPFIWWRMSQMWSLESNSVRVEMIQTTLEWIPKSFFGQGVGFFASLGIHKYPHNYILETFMEAGWVAGIYLMFLIFVGMYSLYQLSKKYPIYRLVLSLYVLEVVMNLFTGDITGIKLFYMFLTLGIYHYHKYLYRQKLTIQRELDLSI